MLRASVLHPFHLLCMGVIGRLSRCDLSSAIAVKRFCNQLIEEDGVGISVRFKARSPVLLSSFSVLEIAVARLSPKYLYPP
jgi:hypothetical protein